MWNSGLRNWNGQRPHKLFSLNRAEGNSEPKKKWNNSLQSLEKESEPEVSKASSQYPKRTVHVFVNTGEIKVKLMKLYKYLSS